VPITRGNSETCFVDHNESVKKSWGLLLAPGASADSTQTALVAIEAAVPAQVAVCRMDFPYRLAGRRAPDRQPVLVEALVDAATKFAATAGIRQDRVFIGGRSMGGRIGSVAVAEGLPAAGLVLISYPLHPPGKPEKLRVDHFGALEVPCLFVSGTRDAFGTRQELRRYARRIPGSKDFEWIEGGDHGLRKYDERTAGLVSQWLTRRIERS
jgi:predicted alpha/beta-hydrolase family hydrolase